VAAAYRIEVIWRRGTDGRAVDLLGELRHLGIEGVAWVQVSSLYFLRGQLPPNVLDRLAVDLLADPVVEGYHWQPADEAPSHDVGKNAIEVGLRPGVTDPVAVHLLKRAGVLGIDSVEAATTGTRYVFDGNLSTQDLHTIAREILCNDIIQRYTLGHMQPAFVPCAEPSDQVDVIPISELDDAALVRLSTERVLFLSLNEMQAIQAEFRRIGRDPTDVELELLAQTWSEHCVHKTFRADIDYTCHGGTPRVVPGGEESSGAGRSGEEATGRAQPSRSGESSGAVGGAGDDSCRERIPGLLRATIRAATERLNRPWVLSAFVDNAGVIELDEAFEVSFKVETHNHPSALEPFGGANTGVGGVIRDIIGVSARPIANTDVLCFGPPELPDGDVPAGTLHPRRIARGVVAGIGDYGNKMGIPTVSGAILYDKDYTCNPLVFCGCVGLAPKGRHRTKPQPEDLCVAVGGRTGRDGLHGATFSSAELTHQTGETVGSVVQIGDPITEKAVLEAVMQARDEGLYNAITDCGAGGFSSAVGEMGKSTGVDVDLQNVRLKYPGLRPWEIWLSEAQERMVMAVPEPRLPRLIEICETLDVEWTVIGRFRGDRQLRVRYGDEVLADLSMQFVHEGWPRAALKAEWSPAAWPEPVIARKADQTDVLLRMLAHPDVASKEDVIRRYDHEVQGACVIKPLVGVGSDGPSDAAVLGPLVGRSWAGIGLGCGVNPHYGRVDPYAMAWAVVDEAIRNVVSVGADPDRVALLDNFCWGSPGRPDQLGGLVRAAQGCHDAAMAYGAPFISGKDSLNNEFVDVDGKKRAIPPTLLISSLGLVPDIRKAVTMDLKRVNSFVYAVGTTRAELGGSLYHRLHGAVGAGIPLAVVGAIETFRAIHRAIVEGLVLAVHDLSEGGLGVAAAEMVVAGRLGLMVSLAAVPRTSEMQDDATILFSESCARFLVEVATEQTGAFEEVLAGHPHARIGQVVEDQILRVSGLQGDVVVEAPIEKLRKAWQAVAAEQVR
jgi:phosphoribosylformylglycinamidine synthase II